MSSNFSTDINKMLTAIRKSTGWTEHQIAQALGICQSQINRILNGKCKNTSGEKLLKINAFYQKKCAIKSN